MVALIVVVVVVIRNSADLLADTTFPSLRRLRRTEDQAHASQSVSDLQRMQPVQALKERPQLLIVLYSALPTSRISFIGICFGTHPQEQHYQGASDNHGSNCSGSGDGTGKLALQQMVALASQLGLVGCWFGGLPIPLDWDQPWQQWPCSCVLGTTIGYLFGLGIGVALVALQCKGIL